jgi:hypothetical protein
VATRPTGGPAYDSPRMQQDHGRWHQHLAGSTDANPTPAWAPGPDVQLGSGRPERPLSRWADRAPSTLDDHCLSDRSAVPAPGKSGVQGLGRLQAKIGTLAGGRWSVVGTASNQALRARRRCRAARDFDIAENMFYMFSAMLFEERLSNRAGHGRLVQLGSTHRTTPRPRRDGPLPISRIAVLPVPPWHRNPRPPPPDARKATGAPTASRVIRLSRRIRGLSSAVRHSGPGR